MLARLGAALLACWLLAGGPAGAVETPGPELLADLPSRGEPGARLVDLATRPGVRQRLLLLQPPGAKASLFLLVGGDGRLNLDQDFILGTQRGNFLKRIARRLASQGFVIALVDQAREEQSFFGGTVSRDSAEHAQDLAGVAAFLRREAALPVWLVGTSMGTISAANAAARLGPGVIDGLVLSSTLLGGASQAGVFALDLGAIRQPVLVIHHRDDGCHLCPHSQVQSLLDALKSAPLKELLTYHGGLPDRSNACEALSAHGYLGLEDQVAQDLGMWIKAHITIP